MEKLFLNGLRIGLEGRSYFKSRKIDVVDMIMTLFDDEQIWKAYAKDIERDSVYREARETAIRMIKDGDLSLEKIARYVPSLSLDELKELEAEVMRSA